jgi:hypothetical protein
MLLVSGVALDLVGAGVLSHAHNAESIAELREDIGEEGAAVGEPDALSTHAQLLAEKRIGFLFLTLGLVLYLSGVVLKSPEGLAMMGSIAVGVVMAASSSASPLPGWLATGYATRHAGPWSSKTPMRYPSSSTHPPSTERDDEESCCGPRSGQLQGIGSFDTQWKPVSSSLASLTQRGCRERTR